MYYIFYGDPKEKDGFITERKDADMVGNNWCRFRTEDRVPELYFYVKANNLTEAWFNWCYAKVSYKRGDK